MTRHVLVLLLSLALIRSESRADEPLRAGASAARSARCARLQSDRLGWSGRGRSAGGTSCGTRAHRLGEGPSRGGGWQRSGSCDPRGATALESPPDRSDRAAARGGPAHVLCHGQTRHVGSVSSGAQRRRYGSRRASVGRTRWPLHRFLSRVGGSRGGRHGHAAADHVAG